MAKKTQNKKKNGKKPKKGDNVFLIGASKHIEMHYRDDIIINGQKVAYCTWIIPKMQDRNLDECYFDFYSVDLLTLERPKTPGQIFPI